MLDKAAERAVDETKHDDLKGDSVGRRFYEISFFGNENSRKRDHSGSSYFPL